MLGFCYNCCNGKCSLNCSWWAYEVIWIIDGWLLLWRWMWWERSRMPSWWMHTLCSRMAPKSFLSPWVRLPLFGSCTYKQYLQKRVIPIESKCKKRYNNRRKQCCLIEIWIDSSTSSCWSWLWDWWFYVLQERDFQRSQMWYWRWSCCSRCRLCWTNWIRASWLLDH